MNQLDLHKRIDKILKRNPEEIKKEEILNLVSVNFDAKNYFYTQADERWLDWLWKNSFLDVVKSKAKDPTRYSYQIPELRYLVRAAEKNPKKVAEIIIKEKTATTEKKFNPEVVDQFLRICAELPAKYLVKVIPKIKRQNWLRLMSPFSPYGFEYEKMFETLYKARDIDSMLKLAELVLEVKSKKELEEKIVKFGGTEFPVDIDNPFYFKDSSYIKVFDYLAKIEDEKYLEKAFELVAKTMAQVIEARKKEDKDKPFTVYDFMLLIDEDFFDIDLKERARTFRQNAANLAAIIKILAEKFITKHCQSDPKKVKEFFDNYIGMFDDENAFLPDSKAMWRFRLFVLSLCPQVFKEELKKSFWRLFKELKKQGNSYYQIISGAEYEKALQKSFASFGLKDRREYVDGVIKHFTQKQEEDKDKRAREKKIHLKYGERILSVIMNDQAVKERQEEIEKLGFVLNPAYEPGPSIRSVQSGFVSPRGPISPEEFNKLPVKQTAKNLQTIWTPDKLREENKAEDFLKPLNAEGASNLLMGDIPKRFQDYINNAVLFFDREKLDPHYTYSFLRGIQEALRNNKVDTKGVKWDNLIKLFIAIKESGEEKFFGMEKRDRGSFDAWLANWTAVHSAMVDVIQELLREKDDKIVINFKDFRDKIFNILKYLLNFSYPTPEDEQIETARSKTKSPDDPDYMISDPFTMAINTVRGRAFEAFLLFIHRDGKRLKKDVKEIYRNVLKKENTRALMFMFGHYLPSFYFRDKEWFKKKKLFPQIFSRKENYLDLAAAEGYLSQSLYKELFEELREYYQKWIELEDTKYPNQKHFKDIDEALADHLALAFIYFDIKFDKDKGFKDELLEKFWTVENKNNQKRFNEFISFIGRHVFSKDHANILIKEHDINIEKLEDFWDWALRNISDPKILAGFGYWANPNEEVIKDEALAQKMAATLKNSKGQIDWDYGFVRRLPELAKLAPDNTLVVIRKYLLDDDNNLIGYESRIPIFEQEYKQALEIIYNQGDEYKPQVTNLINILIAKGGQPFWPLEEIIK